MRLIRNKNHKRRNIIIASVAVAALAGGVAAALLLPSSPFALNKRPADRPENTVSYDKPTKEEKDAGEKAKEDFINRTQNDSSKSNPSPTDQNDSNPDAYMTISSANQNGQTYQIRVIIYALDRTGTCTLTLSRQGSDNVVQTAGTQILGSYSVCQGFDIPTTQLAKGDWQAEIKYNGNAGKATATQSIKIQ